jgi:hypothetical protein
MMNQNSGQQVKCNMQGTFFPLCQIDSHGLSCELQMDLVA